MLMAIFTKVIGLMTKQMGLGYMFIKTEQNMKVIGKMTCNMAQELSYGLTAASIKVDITMV